MTLQTFNNVFLLTLITHATRKGDINGIKAYVLCFKTLYQCTMLMADGILIE